MSSNYHVPKKQYTKDINLINYKFGHVLDREFNLWVSRGTEYHSSLFPMYPGGNFFTAESLNNLEVVRDLRSVGLEVHHVNVFFQKPNVLAELHIDDGANPRHATINLPLRGCTGSKILWVRADQFAPDKPYLATFPSFSVKAKPRTIGSQPEDKSVLRDDATWDIVDTADAGQTIILKTDEWHAVDNRDNANYRWLFAIRFVDNPPYEEVLEKLKSIGL
jgi:hypothetical protein